MHAEKFQAFFLFLYFGKSQLMIVICDVSLALLAVFCSPDHLTWGFGLNVTHAGVFLQGYNDGVGGKT